MDMTESTMTGTNEMGSTLGRGVDQACRSAHSAIDKASDAARPAIGRIQAVRTRRSTEWPGPRRTPRMPSKRRASGSRSRKGG